jgi:hypothetical protein
MMNIKLTIVSIALFISLASLQSQARASTDAVTRFGGLSSEVRLELDRESAPVKSQWALERELNSLQTSPLRYLSAAARAEFVESLQFGDNGLASFKYLPLARELTPSQIYLVLQLFGFQELTANFHNARIENELDARLIQGQKVGVMNDGIREGQCVWRATCQASAGHWCHVPSCQNPYLPK